MHYDYKTLYEKHAAFYRVRPVAKKLLLACNPAFTVLFFLAYGGLLCYAFSEAFEPIELVKLFGIPVFCLFLVFILRLAIERPRPYSENGANITPFLRKKSKDKESFPSRHLASAFVIAFAFLPYLPWLGGVLLALGSALGYIRFALGLHYPSDLLGGTALGCLCGIFFFL